MPVEATGRDQDGGVVKGGEDGQDEGGGSLRVIARNGGEEDIVD